MCFGGVTDEKATKRCEKINGRMRHRVQTNLDNVCIINISEP